MKTILSISALCLFLTGCTFGENPDTENFDIQHQEPSLQEAEEKLFESTYEVIRSSEETPQS